MRQICVILFLLAGVCAFGQEAALKAALYLSGASAEEEVPDGLVEQLETVGRIRVNSPRLRPGLLLSDYQVASILDYRATSGDILSYEELALLDGFSREYVEALKPYLSLESSSLPGAVDTVRLRWTLLGRAGLKNAGGKLKLNGKNWQLGGAFRGYYSGEMDGSAHLQLSGRLGRLVLGNYNLRYGQGLALWSGFSMAFLSTVDAFLWRSAGLSPVVSFNSSSVCQGVAYEYASGHWRGTLFGSYKGGSALLGTHLDWLSRHGQVGLSVIYGAPKNLTVSVDTRWDWKGWDAAAELAWRETFALKSALRKGIGEHWKLALQGRMIPSRFSGKKNGEYALALGTSFLSGRWVPLSGRTGFGSSVPAHRASLTADAALLPIPSAGETGRLQIRVYGNWQWQMAPAWSLSLRLTERYRNYEAPRTALRADLHYGSGPWNTTFRSETVHCPSLSPGGLAYIEGGYKGEKLQGYLRLSGFWIDDWDSRIYVYERDAPGNFSVPAYYGRGGSLSAFCGWKHRFRRSTLRLYLRTAILLRKDREAAPTLNFQVQWDRQ